ncbi:amino acid adenylation domain-containing protein [Streptomyces sp. ACA25]|uniref:amino acid adenylation domain-containing protein n=1 Tax=Streptomyces sp. ACA25 TaxID=3022596 RepID=UPI0023077E5B|nr:amino acid adenylation domain-containing protein [Streptomyces sp. ACA25]MDB1089561.1 amino acid adenylation domain-containing protein [Streptomyces sp. ACA25]
MNPFDDPAGEFGILVNDEGQHCLWPAGTTVPAGWRAVVAGRTREECLDHIEQHWTDLRPRTLVRAEEKPGDAPAPEGLPVDLFEAQVRWTPDVTAVESEDRTLSYAELNTEANRLAHHLLSRGIGPEHTVALVLPRSAELIVALLAALKAGAAYLPVDAEYPADRIGYLLDDARPSCVLTTSALLRRMGREDVEGARTLLLDGPGQADPADCAEHNPVDDDRPVALREEHPAYVVYTSGSTGRPKGIAMPGGGLLHLLAWHRAALPGGVGTRTAQFTAIGFDFSVQEILGTLVAGKTLVVPSDDTRRDPGELVDWIDRCRVQELYAPTAAIESLMLTAQEKGSALPSLTDVYQGGEALQVDGGLRDFCRRSGIRLHNIYGPAEVHVATAYTLPGDPSRWPATAPLGPVIPDVRLYVLDERLTPVAPGEQGELYISGPQVSRGYRDRPALTAQRFVADIQGPPGSRMYRTGDLGRYNADGHVEFHGRTDDQVKVRGFRVEPGEIESALLAHPAVSRAVVVARPDGTGGPQLVAYVIGGVDMAAVRQHAVRVLPGHLIPAVFVPVHDFPLAPNGKVDRAALPAPLPQQATGSRQPRTDRERTLCELFAEALRVPSVGPDDNFFELGGHSLMAGRLTARIRSVLGTPVSVRLLYRAPTVAALTETLGKQAA